MVYRCEGDLHSDLMVENLEHRIIEILGVINCDLSRDAIVANDILSEDFFYGCKAYVCDGLRLNPFHEVLDCHTSYGIVDLCWG
jgi:hypothetical protein